MASAGGFWVPSGRPKMIETTGFVAGGDVDSDADERVMDAAVTLVCAGACPCTDSARRLGSVASLAAGAGVPDADGPTLGVERSLVCVGVLVLAPDDPSLGFRAGLVGGEVCFRSGEHGMGIEPSRGWTGAEVVPDADGRTLGIERTLVCVGVPACTASGPSLEGAACLAGGAGVGLAPDGRWLGVTADLVGGEVWFRSGESCLGAGTAVAEAEVVSDAGEAPVGADAPLARAGISGRVAVMLRAPRM